MEKVHIGFKKHENKTRGINKYSKLITFHPDGYLSPAIIPAGTFCREEISRRRLEPVPSLLKIPVTNWRAITNREVVIETSFGLPCDDLVISFVAGVLTL